MAFVSGGSLYGRFNGATIGFAFNTSNANNPNAEQALDLFQIVGEGGATLLNVTNTGVVHAPGVSPTNGTVIAQIEGTSVLGTTAALVCQGTFPGNYNNQKYDIFQISTDTQLNAIEGGGGGAEIYRLTYQGVGTTS